MKKILLIASLALGISLAAAAQPRAIGARMGWGFEASYQHTMKGADFLEADLGLFTYALNGAVVYNFMIAQPAWTDRGEWGFYAGPGGAVGIGVLNGTGGFNLSAAGQVGLEYTFWLPLQLSVDIRPYFGFHVNDGFHDFGSKCGFYNYGMLGFVPTLSVRYRF